MGNWQKLEPFRGTLSLMIWVCLPLLGCTVFQAEIYAINMQAKEIASFLSVPRLLINGLDTVKALN